jgi:DNA helicase-2/ATP-dependent DNA helicase PcrA
MSRATLFGPPGTGKTTTLSRWAQQAAAKHGGENIMICSLTRTAAAEIRSRDTAVPEYNVGTLHAHAYRSLEDVEVMGKEAIDEWNESYPHWRIDQRGFDEEQASTGGGQTALARYDLARARCTPRGDLPPGLAAFAAAYESHKETRNLIDFTDMIQQAIDHIDCPVDYIIMDEAQDCSALEFKLLSKWAEQCKGAVIAGDDDQAAYEWRGASVDAFLGFSGDQRVLGKSYRLPQRVKERADAWIRQIKNRKEKKYDPRDGSPGVAVELEYRRPEEIVHHALSQPGTSMLLTTCGYMTSPFVSTLKSIAEPFCNPYRERGDFASTWNPLLSGGKRAITASDSVRAFLSPPWTWRTARAWLRELADLPRGTKKLLDDNKRSDNLCAMEWLSSVLGETGLMAALGGDLDWFLSRLKADKKRRQMMNYRVRVAKKHGLEGLTEKPKVIVGTIHSVKGGQADNVYLVPDLSGQAREHWRDSGQSSQILRQMYIGMTRAKERLFLIPPSRNEVIRW